VEGQTALFARELGFRTATALSSPTPLVTDLVGLAMQNATLKNGRGATGAFPGQARCEKLAGNAAYRDSIATRRKCSINGFPMRPIRK